MREFYESIRPTLRAALAISWTIIFLIALFSGSLMAIVYGLLFVLAVRSWWMKSEFRKRHQ